MISEFCIFTALQNTLSSLNYEFVKLLIRLIGGGLAPSSQMVGSLLRSNDWQIWSEKWIRS